MRVRHVMAQARWEIRSVLSNGEQLLLTMVIPILLLVGLGTTSVLDIGDGDRLALVVAGVLTVAVMSSAFTSLAIATAFDRRSGALVLLGTTPLTRLEWGLGRVLAVLAVEALQLILVVCVAALLGWSVTGLAWLVIMMLLGTCAFGAVGLLLGGTVRAEGVLAIANGVYLVLLFAGGTVIAADRLPQWLASVVSLLPSGALGDGLRAAATEGPVPATSLIVLGAWAAGAAAIAVRAFRWR